MKITITKPQLAPITLTITDNGRFDVIDCVAGTMAHGSFDTVELGHYSTVLPPGTRIEVC